jgi:endonuclease/exonuclease/phosphatase family metal-dependent hydrolase
MRHPYTRLTEDQLRSGRQVSVSKAVMELRRLLRDKEHKIIVTHSKVGYEFRPAAAGPPDGPSELPLPISEVSVLSFNCGGADAVKGGPEKFADLSSRLQKDVDLLAEKHKPLVMCFQEVVMVTDPVKGTVQLVLEAPRGYAFKFVPSFNSSDNAAPDRLKTYRKSGWPEHVVVAQGMAIAIRDGVPRASVWECVPCPDQDSIPVETVPVSRGLNPGRRDTETRVYTVLHLLLPHEGLDLDVYINNVHLPTLTGEREGVPAREIAGSARRLQELETVVMNSIVSLMEDFRREQAPKQAPAVWLLAGDLNCTPDSREMEFLKACRFVDLNVNKGRGTKRRKGDSEPTITVDYVLAGCLFGGLDGFLAGDWVKNHPNPEPIGDSKSSDHLPVFAKLPFSVLASRRG